MTDNSKAIVPPQVSPSVHVNTQSIWQEPMQPQTQASLGTGLTTWYKSLPVTTRSVFTLCTSIYIVCLVTGFTGPDLGHVCLSAHTAVTQLQVYRFLTAPFFHSGILHVAFNMLAFVPDAQHLERQLGTVQFLHTLVLVAVAADVLYIVLAFAAAFSFFGTSLLYSCAVGFSGVIFAVIVIETHLSTATTRSIFGFFTVPAQLYPWVLLLLWQLLMWNSVSFLGHLCGLLAGELYARGALNWAKLTSATCRRIDQLWPCSLCYQTDGYISASSQLPTSYPAAVPASSSRFSVPSTSAPSWAWLSSAWPARATWPSSTAASGASQPLLQPHERAQHPQFPGNPHTVGAAGVPASPAVASSDEQRPTAAPAVLAAAAEARLAGQRKGPG